MYFFDQGYIMVQILFVLAAAIGGFFGIQYQEKKCAKEGKPFNKKQAITKLVFIGIFVLVITTVPQLFK